MICTHPVCDRIAAAANDVKYLILPDDYISSLGSTCCGISIEYHAMSKSHVEQTSFRMQKPKSVGCEGGFPGEILTLRQVGRVEVIVGLQWGAFGRLLIGCSLPSNRGPTQMKPVYPVIAGYTGFIGHALQ